MLFFLLSNLRKRKKEENMKIVYAIFLALLIISLLGIAISQVGR